jgi:hypothetical protein
LWPDEILSPQPVQILRHLIASHPPKTHEWTKAVDITTTYIQGEKG